MVHAMLAYMLNDTHTHTYIHTYIPQVVLPHSLLALPASARLRTHHLTNVTLQPTEQATLLQVQVQGQEGANASAYVNRSGSDSHNSDSSNGSSGSSTGSSDGSSNGSTGGGLVYLVVQQLRSANSHCLEVSER